jgi:hypothetical protein
MVSLLSILAQQEPSLVCYRETQWISCRPMTCCLFTSVSQNKEGKKEGSASAMSRLRLWMGGWANLLEGVCKRSNCATEAPNHRHTLLERPSGYHAKCDLCSDQTDDPDFRMAQFATSRAICHDFRGAPRGDARTGSPVAIRSPILLPSLAPASVFTLAFTAILVTLQTKFMCVLV